MKRVTRRIRGRAWNSAILMDCVSIVAEFEAKRLAENNPFLEVVCQRGQ